MKVILTHLLICVGLVAQAQSKMPAILPLRKQAEVIDQLFEISAGQ